MMQQSCTNDVRFEIPLWFYKGHVEFNQGCSHSLLEGESEGDSSQNEGTLDVRRVLENEQGRRKEGGVKTRES